MKIEGETIKKTADQLDHAGKTVEPALHAVDNVLGEVGRRLVHPMSRKARIVEFKEAAFENADDWTAAQDGAVTVHAAVTGGTTVDLSEPVEFIHYGRVYRDRSHLFPCGKVEDIADTLPSDANAHGLMYRAALQRESILLGGFIRAQMDALIAEERSKGVIGVLAQVLADLGGSAGGTQDKPNAVDLNPHLKKVIEAGKPINRPKVDYPALHTAGIELHTARKAYREYLVKENEKRHAPAKTPGEVGADGKRKPGGGILNDQVPELNKALAAGGDWVGAKHDAVPKLTVLVPPGVQDFLSLAQKISFKAWDVCACINYEYAIRLEPIIEDACRRMTEDSVKKRSAPVFPVWNMAAQPEYHLPVDVEKKIFDKVDNPFGDKPILKKLNEWADVVTDPVKDALTKYDQKVGIDKTLDFLSRPDRYTPGRPFLDDIFLIPPDLDPPDVPDAAKRARVGWSGGLGQMAVDSATAALGMDHMPEFFAWTIGKISTVCAEFIRGVYCKILVLPETAQVTEAEILESAKRHLVGNLIESILGGIDFVQKLRNEKLDIPIAEVAFSVDAIIGRAKEFAAQKLDEFLDPIVKFAMRDLHQMIFAYRKTAIDNRALTMEVHLAQLPTVFSRLFRNVFFPLWDKVLEKSLEAITSALSPRIMEAGKSILKARAQVEEVRGKIVQGLAALESLPKTLPDVGFDIKHPKDSVQKIKNDWNPIAKNAKKAWDDAEIEVTQDLPALEHDELEQAFPVKQRLSRIEVAAITPEHLKIVAPQLKWRRRDGKLAAYVDDPSKKKAPSEVKNGTASPKTTPALAPHTESAPASQHYPMGDYPISTPQPGLPTSQPMYAQYQTQSQEQTQELHVSPDLHELAALEDVEQTVDIDHAAISALPPFLGNTTKKA
ncbi:MAG TPA: hypothetical protein VL400_18065 [Polyangiaceae bacterium]|nr:hypothetical protein [Polyangiaceae bacterium]